VTNNDQQSSLNHLQQFIKSSDWSNAKTLADTLISEQPDNAEIITLTAEICRGLNQRYEAVEYMGKAAALKPGNKSLQLAYVSDLLKIEHLDEAESALTNIPQTQQNDVDVLLMRSHIYYQRKNFESATDLRTQIISQQPKFATAHLELAHVLLMRNKWRAGWIEYEWRYEVPQARKLLPRFKIPTWDGATHHKNILLIADQGYGDCFQFSRYIPMVAKRCDQLLLLRSKPLARLLDTIPGIYESYSEWQDVTKADAYCTLSGLPRRFATTPDTIPSCEDLLKVNEDDVVRWRDKIKKSVTDTKLKIGITWSGRPEFTDNHLRAVPIEAISSLLEIPHTRFFSLQLGDVAHQSENRNMVDLSADLKDFAETAAVIKNLDLVITSDTSVAHLAGTLGCPAWVFLRYAPDWRWGSEGSASLWYPSVRLFRQDHNRSWVTIIAESKRLLREIVSSDYPPRLP